MTVRLPLSWQGVLRYMKVDGRAKCNHHVIWYNPILLILNTQGMLLYTCIFWTVSAVPFMFLKAFYYFYYLFPHQLPCENSFWLNLIWNVVLYHFSVSHDAGGSTETITKYWCKYLTILVNWLLMYAHTSPVHCITRAVTAAAAAADSKQIWSPLKLSLYTVVQ